MKPPPSRSIAIAHQLVICLLLLTPILLLWQQFGMSRTIELFPHLAYPVRAQNDIYDKGNSVVSLVRTPDALTMRCAFGAAATWPYCRLQFLISAADKGIDLSRFDTISFDLRYTGPAPPKFRIHLVNFDPGSSTVDDWHSRRYNEAEIDLPADPAFSIPVNVVRTADWWKGMRKIPLSQSYTRIDNVTAVEIATSSTPPGEVTTIELRSLRFHGKWISQTQLLMYLVYAWIACGIFGLYMGLRHYRSNLLATHSRLEQLAEINKALELEARELTDQAHTDPLTGALNRQGLREALLRRLDTPEHYSQDLAVIFMDIDHFKQVNDRHGHDAGDEVLRRFAATVRREVRASDKLVRWGGEEFLLLCPDTNQEHVATTAEKLRASIGNQEWPHGLRITASFGATALHPAEDIGAAIARADGALYAAKANGRNRVEVA